MPHCEQELPITNMFSETVCQHNAEGGKEFEGKFYCIFHLPAELWANLTKAEKEHFVSQFGQKISKIVNSVRGSSEPKSNRPACDFRNIIIPSGFPIKNYLEPRASIPNSDFNAAVVLGGIDLSGLEFQGLISFANVDFRGVANFSSSRNEQDGIVSFSGSKFRNESNFEHCNFAGPPDFSDVEFFEFCSFKPSHLRQANFSGTIFHGGCDFEGADLHQITKFDNSEFGKSAGDESDAKAHFHGTVFNGATSFRGAKFNCPINLDSAEFKNSINFLGANFRFAPTLIGTKFEEDANFEETSFEFGDEATFRKIKKLMELQRHFWEATWFYGRELSEQRKALKGIKKISLNLLFWWLNDYGRKWRLPLVWLAGSVVVFAAIFYFTDSMVLPDEEKLEGWEKRVPYYYRIWQALLFSAQNLKLSWLVGKPVILAKTGWFWFVSGIQTVINVVLITMTILSIRRRFKIF